MKPTEKAIELVEQFMEHTVEWDKIKEIAYDSKFHAKECALIAVNEIIDAIDWNESEYPVSEELFWLDVIKEIKKI